MGDLAEDGRARAVGDILVHLDAAVDRAGERLGSAAAHGNAGEGNEGQNALVVARVEPRERRVAVYNLEVSRYHTYFVGDRGVWVHNAYSPNQANKMIQQGKAPSTILRVDVGKAANELTHVHFAGGAALNNNGTWKHGSRILSKAEEVFVTEVLGWPLPR